MKKRLLALSLLALSTLPASLTQASQVQIDLSSQINANLANYAGGSNYPAGGTALKIGAAQFNLADNLGGVGAVQLYGQENALLPTSFVLASSTSLACRRSIASPIPCLA